MFFSKFTAFICQLFNRDVLKLVGPRLRNRNLQILFRFNFPLQILIPVMLISLVLMYNSIFNHNLTDLLLVSIISPLSLLTLGAYRKIFIIDQKKKEITQCSRIFKYFNARNWSTEDMEKISISEVYSIFKTPAYEVRVKLKEDDHMILFVSNDQFIASNISALFARALKLELENLLPGKNGIVLKPEEISSSFMINFFSGQIDIPASQPPVSEIYSVYNENYSQINLRYFFVNYVRKFILFLLVIIPFIKARMFQGTYHESLYTPIYLIISGFFLYFLLKEFFGVLKFTIDNNSFQIGEKLVTERVIDTINLDKIEHFILDEKNNRIYISTMNHCHVFSFSKETNYILYVTILRTLKFRSDKLEKMLKEQEQ